ncbi:MAG: LysE family transporter [Alistipes sp.]|nr:LysE family transporter [Alistipes sp.]
MVVSLFIRGILIGLVASIPLGPVGVLCIQRTLSRNQRSGFVSGLGAASADMIFASIAFFSLSFVLSFIRDNMTVIKVVGGMCVMLVGVSIFMSNPVVQIRRNRAGRSNLWQDFISLFFITLANPAFILIFIALFATFGFSEQALGMGRGMVMIGGLFCGGATWWLVLTSVVGLLRGRFRPRHLLWINRITGTAIVVLGAATVLLMFVNTPVDGLLH